MTKFWKWRSRNKSIKNWSIEGLPSEKLGVCRNSNTLLSVAPCGNHTTKRTGGKGGYPRIFHFRSEPRAGCSGGIEGRKSGDQWGASGFGPFQSKKNRLGKIRTFDSENRKLESKIGPKTDQKVITQQLGIPSTVGIGKLVSKYTGGSHGGYNEGNCKVGNWGLKPPSFSENFLDFFAYTGHY